MNLKFKEFFSLSGRLPRRSFFILQIIALVLVSLLARVLFHAQISLSEPSFDWLFVFTNPIKFYRINLANESITNALDIPVVLAMVLLLFFAYFMSALTVRRLRDGGLPVYLFPFIFLPYLSFIFLPVLMLLPSHDKQHEENQKFWDDFMPKEEKDCIWIGILITGVFAYLLSSLSTVFFKEYGYALFVLVPFSMGLLPVLIASYRAKIRFVKCLKISFLSVVFVGILLFLLAFEGLICILMAFPVAIICALLGASFAYFIQLILWSRKDKALLVLALLVLNPVLMGAEYYQALEPETFQISTEIEINAPPEKVWAHVVKLPAINSPKNFFFKLGVSHPRKTIIDGEGIGAVRYCVFSTGRFVEPIDKWQEGKILSFPVVEQPAPMKELSFFDIHPPHLDKFLVNKRGEYKLEKLAGGRTRLIGTSWYSHDIWPASYWKMWSDYLIRECHRMVLLEIKKRSEELV